MPNVFKSAKQNSVKRLNGKTPQWFRDWHGTEFMEMKLRVTGLLWLVSLLFLTALSIFGVMLTDYLK